MVIYERIKDTDLIRAYSSNYLKIIQDGTGNIYEEAIDPDFCNRTYTESDEPIENILSPIQVLEAIFGDGEIPDIPEESKEEPQND